MVSAAAPGWQSRNRCACGAAVGRGEEQQTRTAGWTAKRYGLVLADLGRWELEANLAFEGEHMQKTVHLRPDSRARCLAPLVPTGGDLAQANVTASGRRITPYTYCC